MKGLGIFLFFLVLFSCINVQAQTVIPDRIVPDTTVYQYQYEESDRFYDNLKEKAGESRWARRLYRALVSEESRADSSQVEPTLAREVDYFKQFAGQRVNSIHVYRNNIFSDEYPKGDLRLLANSLHRVTEENRIRRNLLFAVGDLLSPALLARNESLLRSQDYLSDAYIVVNPSETGDGVDVFVITRDSWNIGIAIHNVPRISGRRYLDIYDNNFLGTGNRLDLRTYVSYRGKRIYGGNMLEYHAANLWGSFFDLNMIGGWGYQEHRAGIRIHKPFLLQSDYMAGGAAEDNKYYEQQMMYDTMALIRHRNLDAYAGKSWDFPETNSIFYLTGRYQDLEYIDRPEVRADTNSYYHSRRMALFSTGLYRETYYRGNMIFGYGNTENIPYGHKFEFTGGRIWSEFGDKYYGAFTAAVGRQTRRGYVRAEASISSYLTDKNKLEQTAFGFNIDAFSNLWRIRRSYVRQFFRLRYLQGFHRYSGEGEELTFYEVNSPRGFRLDPDYRGRVRLTMNMETVVFTPLYLYGFRFAFFGFSDFGWIGNYNMPFRNDFFTSLGIGVRIKNERLIFNTIQLRLGVGFSRHGLADYRYVWLSSEQRLKELQFKADRPELQRFR